MVPTSATMGLDDGNPRAFHDRTGFNANVPGEGLIQELVNAAISVVQHAAGACAELIIGIEHEKCGWTGDFIRFKPFLDAISRICGYSYDHCWNLTSAMAKEILAEPAIWDSVEMVATALDEKGQLGRKELAELLRDRPRPRHEEMVATLLEFVSTSNATRLAKAQKDGLLPFVV
jgi:hypothetical protein